MHAYVIKPWVRQVEHPTKPYEDMKKFVPGFYNFDQMCIEMLIKRVNEVFSKFVGKLFVMTLCNKLLELYKFTQARETACEISFRAYLWIIKNHYVYASGRDKKHNWTEMIDIVDVPNPCSFNMFVLWTNRWEEIEKKCKAIEPLEGVMEQVLVLKYVRNAKCVKEINDKIEDEEKKRNKDGYFGGWKIDGTLYQWVKEHCEIIRQARIC